MMKPHVNEGCAMKEEDTTHRRTEMGNRHSQPPCPDLKEYQIDFDEADPWNPKTWTAWKRLYISTIVCCGAFVASFNSAIFATGATDAGKEFEFGSEVMVLGTSLFVLGFAFGPSIWAPGSELIGRRWPLCFGMLGSSIFTIGCAASKDVQTLVVCRFFGGVFGASPICVVPGVLTDLHEGTHRGTAISLYALTVFGGPLLAPVVGEYLAMSYLGWRWTLYLPAILGFFDLLGLILFVHETYAPITLTGKAKQVRKQTGNWAIHAEHERLELDIAVVTRTFLTQPLRMLATEPIILLVSLYMSFVYGLVYALLEAYPYVFTNVYGMSMGVRTLPFIGVLLGVLLAVGFIVSRQSSYSRKTKENNGTFIPEWRLGPAIFGAVIFTVGLFWFAWTGFTASIHWIVPTLSGFFIGFGVLCMFLPCFNYLVDSFIQVAASTVAANIILRSAFASSFPLFAKQLFERLGVQWAGTLLACLSAVMLPIPILLRAYGPAARKRSKVLKTSAAG